VLLSRAASCSSSAPGALLRPAARCISLRLLRLRLLLLLLLLALLLLLPQALPPALLVSRPDVGPEHSVPRRIQVAQRPDAGAAQHWQRLQQCCQLRDWHVHELQGQAVEPGALLQRLWHE
jgi:hypothetical protein